MTLLLLLGASRDIDVGPTPTSTGHVYSFIDGGSVEGGNETGKSYSFGSSGSTEGGSNSGNVYLPGSDGGVNTSNPK